jgi:hypothetical protein
MRRKLHNALTRLNRLRGPSSASVGATSSSRPLAQSSSPLQALTMAALALPGLTHAPARAAEGEDASFQYGHYQEGGGAGSQFRETGKSIQVDTIQASVGARLQDRMRFRFNYQEDTWSGATPIAAAPAGALTPVDSIAEASKFWEIANLVSTFDPEKGVASFIEPESLQHLQTAETVEIMAYASPEIRRQGDARLGYEWDEAALDGGVGVSIENDFDVWFANLGGRMDFNQKRTTVTLGTTYTNSSIDAQRYAYSVIGSKSPEPPTVQGTRQDESVGLGLVQVLDQNSVLEANVGYTHSAGYLSNPYKQSLFFAPIEARQLQRQAGD